MQVAGRYFKPNKHGFWSESTEFETPDGFCLVYLQYE